MTNYNLVKGCVAMVAVELKNTVVTVAVDTTSVAVTGVAFASEYTVRGTDKVQEASNAVVAKLDDVRATSVNFLVARRAKQIAAKIAAKQSVVVINGDNFASHAA